MSTAEPSTEAVEVSRESATDTGHLKGFYVTYDDGSRYLLTYDLDPRTERRDVEVWTRQTD